MLVIQCSSCQTRYHYDESRFGGVAVKKIRCTKCATIFEIQNPAIPSAPPGFQPDETGPLNSPMLGSDDFSLDTTVMGAGPRKRLSAVPQPTVPGATSLPGVGGAVQVKQPLPPPAPFPAGLGAARPPAPTDRFNKTVAPGTPAPESHLVLPESYRLSLACLAGPDSGRIFEVDRPRMTIGRANADIVLSDAQCSRQHAAIEVADEQVYVVDLGSTNGTFFGEKRITRVELDNRAEFDVGATTLMLIKTRKD